MILARLHIALLALLLSYSSMALSARGLPDFTDLIDKTAPAVVKINTVTKSANQQFQLPPGTQIPELFRHFFDPRELQERNLQSMGSGFFISSDGYLLTNNHVIENADEIIVRLTDRTEYEAVLVGADPLSDLALLKVEQKGLPFLKLGNSEDLRVGEWVVAIGSPFGLDFSASAGIVSAKGRSIPNGSNGDYVPFIQTDVAINPGNSGGPLFNMAGDVVGVNSQIYTRSGGSIGLSFAIPATVAKNVVTQLKKKGRVDRGWLGVVIQEVDKDLADSFGLKKPEGALIASLEDRGPADKSGLKAGDIIVKFGESPILDRSDLPHAVGLTPPGSKVPVVVMRAGKRKEIMVVVGTRGGDDVTTTDGSAADSSFGGRLGVVVMDVDDSDLSRWRLKGGVIIEELNPDGAASRAGLQVGDVIAQVGFEEVVDVASFKKIVKDLPADNLLPIRFFRDGQPIFRTITLDK